MIETPAPPAERPTSGRSIFLSSALISLLMLSNLVITVLTQAILARWFGANLDVDAYNVALTIPTLATAIINGSLTVVLVPVLMEARQRKESLRAVLSTLLNLVLLGVGGVAAFAILFPDAYLGLLVPDFSPQGAALAGSLLLPVMLSGVFTSGSAVLAGYVYYESRYSLPTLAQVLNSASILACVALLGGWIGIYSAGLGTLLGSLLQFGLLAWICRKSLGAVIDWRNPALLNSLKVALPLIGALFLYRSVNVLERSFAAGLPDGSISLMAYSYKIVYVLSTVTTVGIATVFLPATARYAIQAQAAELTRTFLRGHHASLFVTLPVLAWLALSRREVISLLLQGGKFTAAEVEVAARLVLLGLGVLFANSAGGVVVNTLYAMRRTAAAVWVNLGGLVFYLVAAPLAAQAWAVDGLALTMSIYFLLTFLAYLAILYRRLEGISWRSEAAYLARLGACCLLALTGAWGISAGLPGLAQVGAGTLLGLAWRLAFQAALLGGLYLLFCLALRVSEVQSLLSRLGQILLRPAAPLTPGEPATKDPS